MAAQYQRGDDFPLQLIWQLPDGDYLRAVFRARVTDHDHPLDRYIVRLEALVAGRQEASDGRTRSTEALSRDYWARVGAIIGRRIHLAYEAADGRPLQLRLATLTGDHTFFFRLDEEE